MGLVCDPKELPGVTFARLGVAGMLHMYLLNYAYHCARMSSNEMLNSFARPY
jgi:hypothetical protein